MSARSTRESAGAGFQWDFRTETHTMGSGQSRSRSRSTRRRFVSLRALAQRWGCDPSTVRRNLEAAGVKAYLLGHGLRGTVRYDLADVEHYEQGSREP